MERQQAEEDGDHKKEAKLAKQIKAMGGVSDGQMQLRPGHRTWDFR